MYNVVDECDGASDVLAVDVGITALLVKLCRGKKGRMNENNGYFFRFESWQVLKEKNGQKICVR